MAIHTPKNKLSKHAHKAIRNGRRRDAKSDRRALQRALNGLKRVMGDLTENIESILEEGAR